MVDRLLHLIALSALLFSFIVPLLYYSALPELIPQHFNFGGKADMWGSKKMIWLIPGISLFLYGLVYLAVSRGFDKDTAHKSPKRLLWSIAAFATVFFAFITWSTIQLALNGSEGIGVLPVLVAFLLSFMLYVLFFRKSDSNAKSSAP